MQLQLNSNFEGYTTVEVLKESTPYREVYRAFDTDGKEHTLIIYLTNILPDYYKEGIPELELACELYNKAIPSFSSKGHFKGDYTSFKWMTREYIKGKTLTEHLNEVRQLNIKESLENFYNILLAVKDISRRMRNGAHNNINTDNIIVSTDNDGKEKWYLIGHSCVSEPCSGSARFNENTQKIEFRAPETTLGIYKQTTDIFSLGIVLSYILQKRHPWSSASEITRPTSLLQYAKLIRSQKPDVEADIPEPLSKIILNATASRQSDRYRTLNEFIYELGEWLGYEHNVTKEQSAPPQPKANVEFEKKKGNGFKDVAGMGELKSNLTRNFVDIMNNMELARQFHVTPPNGLLLYGPPGVGKTFIANKLAEESNLIFNLVQPSDLANIYLHGSQNMIADLFKKSEEMAKKQKRGVLLVFDEFDSLVPKRTGKTEESNQANEVAEFLTRLNNCAEKGIYVLATTNRVESIDPAVLRHGRIDMMIYVGLPDKIARMELFKLELEKRPHETIDYEKLALLTEGYTASDISYIATESARVSFAKSIEGIHIIKITQEIVEKAIMDTRPSVSSEDLKEYEKVRDKYTKAKQENRHKIGFRKI